MNHQPSHKILKQFCEATFTMLPQWYGPAGMDLDGSTALNGTQGRSGKPLRAILLADRLGRESLTTCLVTARGRLAGLAPFRADANLMENSVAKRTVSCQLANVAHVQRRTG